MPFFQASTHATDWPSTPSAGSEGLARFSTAAFERFRNVGDPLADDVVRSLAAHPSEERRETSLDLEAIETRRRASGVPGQRRILEAFLDDVHSTPAWLDFARIEEGRKVFLRHGALAPLVAFVSGWLEVYSVPVVARVLAKTGRQTHDVRRRVLETNRFFSTIYRPDALRPGNAGHRAAIEVRLLHAGVRALIQASGRWPSNLGVPVSQADGAGGRTIFSHGLLHGLERLGVALSDDERASFQHLWSWVGRLMGVDDFFRVDTHHDEAYLFHAIRGWRAAPDDTGRALARVLFEAVADRPPVFLSRSTLEGLGRILVGPHLADRLRLPPLSIRTRVVVGLVRRTARTTSRALHGSPTLDPLAVRAGERAMDFVARGNGKTAVEYVVPTAQVT